MNATHGSHLTNVALKGHGFSRAVGYPVGAPPALGFLLLPADTSLPAQQSLGEHARTGNARESGLKGQRPWWLSESSGLIPRLGFATFRGLGAPRHSR